MPRNRVRIRCKANRKHWRRGDACQSNPTNRKYREMVNSFRDHRSIFLTEEGQFFTNTLNSEQSFDDEHGSVGSSVSTNSTADSWLTSANGLSNSETVSTYKSWISAFTQCTNSTFASIVTGSDLKTVTADNPEIIAVLSTATDVLKAKGLSECNTEYSLIFCTMLMNALSNKEEPKVNREHHVHAIIYLLNQEVLLFGGAIKFLGRPLGESLCFQKISDAVVDEINNQFKLGDTFVGLLCDTCISPAMIAPIFKCLRRLTVHSVDYEVLLGTALIPFTTSSKSQIRHLSRKCMNSMIRKQREILYPVLDYCLTSIKSSNLQLHPSESTSALDLLRCIFAHSLDLEPNETATTANIIEHILRLMRIGDCSYQRASSQTIAIILRNTGSMKSNELCRWLNQIYECGSDEDDIKTSVNFNFFIVSNELLRSLIRVDTKMFLFHISRHIHNATRLIQTNNFMTLVLLDGLFRQYGHQQVNEALIPIELKAFERVINELITAIGRRVLEYHKTIPSLLRHIRVVIQWTNCNTNIDKLLQKIRSLKTVAFKSQQDNLELKKVLGLLVGTLYSKFDPTMLTQILITNDETDLHLLQIIAESLLPGNLEFFIDTLVPLHVKQPQNEQLKLSVCSCLPRCCLRPADGSQNFPKIHKTLLKLLCEPDVLYQKLGFASISNLLVSAETDSQLAEIVRSSTQAFVPVLLNIITSPVSKLNPNNVLKVVIKYLEFVDQRTIVDYFEQCLKEIECPSPVGQVRNQSVMLILRALTPFLGESRLNVVLELCKKQIGCRKKVFKKPNLDFELSHFWLVHWFPVRIFTVYITKFCTELFAEIFNQSLVFSVIFSHETLTLIEIKFRKILDTMINSESCFNFVDTNCHQITEMLMSVTEEGCWTQSKLSCFEGLLELEIMDAQLINRLFFESVSSLRANNARCRRTAKRLFRAVLQKLCETSETSSVIVSVCQKLKEFIVDENLDIRARCSACDALSETLLGRTQCLNGTDVLSKTLLDIVNSIRPGSHRSYVKSGFSLIQQIVNSMNELELLSHIKPVLQLIADSKKEKQPVPCGSGVWSRLLRSLVRKLGHVVLETSGILPPVQFHKILINMAKRENRRNRPVKRACSVKVKEKKKKDDTVMIATDDDFVLDLEDTTRVLGGLCIKNNSSDNDEVDKAFKIDSKGRFVIEDEREQEKTRNESGDKWSDDEDDEVLQIKSKRKGRLVK